MIFQTSPAFTVALNDVYCLNGCYNIQKNKTKILRKCLKIKNYKNMYFSLRGCVSNVLINE
jgi:hypothetical protein